MSCALHYTIEDTKRHIHHPRRVIGYISFFFPRSYHDIMTICLLASNHRIRPTDAYVQVCSFSIHVVVIIVVYYCLQVR